MRINENFLLREVAGNAVVVPVGEAADRFNGMIRLNETAVCIWRAFEQENDVPGAVAALCAEYDTTPEQAEQDVLRLLEVLRKAGILEE